MTQAAMDNDTMVAVTPSGFQSEVADWMLDCFGPEIAADRLERADRFTEEALELAQTMPGFNAERAHALVDYVFGRDIGERGQEVGGVMVTLAALCNTFDISINAEAERELARVWTKVEAIRAKQASKPVGSALPIAHQSVRTGAGDIDDVLNDAYVRGYDDHRGGLDFADGWAKALPEIRKHPSLTTRTGAGEALEAGRGMTAPTKVQIERARAIADRLYPGSGNGIAYEAALAAIIETQEWAASVADNLVPSAHSASDAVVQAERDAEIATAIREGADQ